MQEFTSGCVVLGMRFSRAKAERVFREMDSNRGYVRFDEFCEWCVRHSGNEGRESEYGEKTEARRPDIGGDDGDEQVSLYGGTPDGGSPERGAM